MDKDSAKTYSLYALNGSDFIDLQEFETFNESVTQSNTFADVLIGEGGLEGVKPLLESGKVINFEIILLSAPEKYDVATFFDEHGLTKNEDGSIFLGDDYSLEKTEYGFIHAIHSDGSELLVNNLVYSPNPLTGLQANDQNSFEYIIFSQNDLLTDKETVELFQVEALQNALNEILEDSILQEDALLLATPKIWNNFQMNYDEEHQVMRLDPNFWIESYKGSYVNIEQGLEITQENMVLTFEINHMISG